MKLGHLSKCSAAGAEKKDGRERERDRTNGGEQSRAEERERERERESERAVNTGSKKDSLPPLFGLFRRLDMELTASVSVNNKLPC